MTQTQFCVWNFSYEDLLSDSLGGVIHSIGIGNTGNLAIHFDHARLGTRLVEAMFLHLAKEKLTVDIQ